ncbi:MAG: O-antigen ligase family protein [Gemmatimonadaceae bacterium]
MFPTLKHGEPRDGVANGRHHPWGAASGILAAALLAYVWRIQDLFPIVDHLKPVTLVTGLFFLILFLDTRLQADILDVARRPPGIFAVTVLILASVGIPTSLWAGMSFDIVTKVLLPSVVVALGIGAAVRRTVDAYRFSTVHVIGALIFSLVVLTRFNVGPDGRLGDLIYYDANGLGLIIVCALPLAEWCASHGERLGVRILALAALPVFLITIVKTGSRGAFLGLVAVLTYSIFANRSAPVRRRLGLGLFAGILLLVFAGGTYWTMMNTILHPTQDYNWVGKSEGGRMDVWKRGIGYMLQHPITGVGAGAFPVAEGTISALAGQQQYGIGLKWSAAHSSFVQVGAELGFPGIIAYLAFLFVGFRRARRIVVLGLAASDLRTAAMGDALAASLLGYMVSGFFLSEGYSALPYSVIGIAIGLHTVLRRQVPVEAREEMTRKVRRGHGAAVRAAAWNPDV